MVQRKRIIYSETVKYRNKNAVAGLNKKPVNCIFSNHIINDCCGVCMRVYLSLFEKSDFLCYNSFEKSLKGVFMLFRKIESVIEKILTSGSKKYF